MSSHPPGLRFSSVATSQIPNLKISNNNNNNNNRSNDTNNSNTINNNNNNNKTMQHQQQPQPQTQILKKNLMKQPPPQYTANSLSGSETDISTSNENLSLEQRYVLRHTPRVEPQGQENLQEKVSSGAENQGNHHIFFSFLAILSFFPNLVFSSLRT